MQWIVKLMSGTLVLGLGIGLLVGGIGDLRLQQRLRDDGATVSGTVLTFETDQVPSRRRTEVTYRFSTREGHELQGSDLVGPRTRRQLREGGPVVVQYLVSDPTINQVHEGEEEGLYLVVIMAGALAVLTGLAVTATSLLSRFLPRKHDPVMPKQSIATR